MHYRMLALDLDETTLDENGLLSPRTRKALGDAIDAGVILVVASGRSLTSLPAEIQAFQGIRYAIVSNGAAVFDMKTHACLRHLHIPATAIKAVFRLLESEPHAIPEVCIDGQMYAERAYVENPLSFRDAPHIIAYIQKTRKPADDMKAFCLAHCDEIESMDLVCPDTSEKPRLAQKVLRLVSDVYITSSVPHMVELANKDAGKGSGLRFLAQQEGLPVSQVMALGNADNDADMLLFAGLGVAVENATPACKAAADVLTAAHYEDGAAKAIEKYLLPEARGKR